jgi:hypothetical protein
MGNVNYFLKMRNKLKARELLELFRSKSAASRPGLDSLKSKMGSKK